MRFGSLCGASLRSGLEDRHREQEREGRAPALEELTGQAPTLEERTAKPGSGRQAVPTVWAAPLGRTVSFLIQVGAWGWGRVDGRRLKMRVSPVKSGTRGPWASIPHGKEADETRGQRLCVFRETGASGRL